MLVISVYPSYKRMEQQNRLRRKREEGGKREEDLRASRKLYKSGIIQSGSAQNLGNYLKRFEQNVNLKKIESLQSKK
jgi:hypothetical protein